MARLIRCGCGNQMSGPDESLGREGACTWCGVRFTVTEENSGALDGCVEDAGPASKPAAVCTQCGKAFRGEWDRNPTQDGCLCHFCHRQWRPPAPEAVSLEPSPKVLDTGEWNPAPIHSGDEAAVDDGFERQFNQDRGHARQAAWRKARGPVCFCAFFGLAMLAVAVLPLEQFMAALLWTPPAEERALLPPLARFLILCVHGLSKWTSYAIPLFAALSVTGQLPNDALKKNLIAVAGVALALGLMNFLAIFPFWGRLVVLLQLAFLMKLYDLEIGDFLKFLFVFCAAIFIVRPLLNMGELGMYNVITSVFP